MLRAAAVVLLILYAAAPAAAAEATELREVRVDFDVRGRGDSDGRFVPYRQGRPYACDVDLWNTCQRFARGHRIRVEIASSAFPKYDRNPQTGGPLGRDSELRRANQTLFHDAERPSHVVLPIVPRRTR
jgi:predicted acyl esterase